MTSQVFMHVLCARDFDPSSYPLKKSCRLFQDMTIDPLLFLSNVMSITPYKDSIKWALQ